MIQSSSLSNIKHISNHLLRFTKAIKFLKIEGGKINCVYLDLEWSSYSNFRTNYEEFCNFNLLSSFPLLNKHSATVQM